MIVRNIDKIKEKPASHENKLDPGSYKKILFEKIDFAPGLRPQMINWARIPKKKSFRLHFHQDMVEVFILIKGKVLFQLNNETKIISAGETVLVPEMSSHKMTNIGVSDVEYYVIGLSKGNKGKTVISE